MMAPRILTVKVIRLPVDCETVDLTDLEIHRLSVNYFALKT